MGFELHRAASYGGHEALRLAQPEAARLSPEHPSLIKLCSRRPGQAQAQMESDENVTMRTGPLQFQCHAPSQPEACPSSERTSPTRMASAGRLRVIARTAACRHTVARPGTQASSAAALVLKDKGGDSIRRSFITTTAREQRHRSHNKGFTGRFRTGGQWY